MTNQLPLKRILLIVVAVIMLAVIYVFQQFNFLLFFFNAMDIAIPLNSNYIFIFNKTLRLVLNDLVCMILIYGLFEKRKYMTVSLLVLLIELFLLLPLYFTLKLTIEGDSEISSPLLSQIHRLIVNPMLMILVIISFFYQRLKERNANSNG